MRNLLEMMDMLITLIVEMVTWMNALVQTHQIVHINACRICIQIIPQ